MDPNIIRVHRTLKKSAEKKIIETVLNPGENFNWLNVNSVKKLMAKEKLQATLIYYSFDEEEIAYLVSSTEDSTEEFSAFAVGIHAPFINSPWRARWHEDYQKTADIALARLDKTHPRQLVKFNHEYANLIIRDYRNIWREMNYINNHRFDRPNRSPPGIKCLRALPEVSYT